MRHLPLEVLIPILGRWILSCSNHFQLQTIELKLAEIKEYRHNERGWKTFELMIGQSIRLSKDYLRKSKTSVRINQLSDVWIAHLTKDFIQEEKLRKANHSYHFETFSNLLKDINYAR